MTYLKYFCSYFLSSFLSTIPKPANRAWKREFSRTMVSLVGQNTAMFYQANKIEISEKLESIIHNINVKNWRVVLKSISTISSSLLLHSRLSDFCIFLSFNNPTPYRNNLMKLSAAGTSLIILISVAVFFLPTGVQAECIDGDCVNGQGTYIWPDGEKYVGEWKKGKRNGKGSIIWTDGDRYVGHWKNDKNVGYGNYFCPADAIQYSVALTNTEADGVGCVMGNCVNGYGIYLWLSGAQYVGTFKNSERNGPGTYSFPTGQIIKGIWNNGKYVGKKYPKLSKWGG